MSDPFDPTREGPRTVRLGARRGLGWRARVALAVYGTAGRMATPWLRGHLRRRARRGKEERHRRPERFGRASVPRPSGPLAWVHAASVGETHAVMAVAEHLVERGIAVVFTTGTVTAAAIVGERLGHRVTHQYAPLDIAPGIRRFLDHWMPDLVVIAESEVWPTTLLALSDRRVPCVLVNARMSEASHRRWRRMGARFGLSEALFARFAHVAARGAEDAARFEDLGAAPVTVTGDLKAETLAPRVPPALKNRYRAMIGHRPVWAAVSTHAGEEEIAGRVHLALRAHQPDLLTVVVPRHPERGEDVTRKLKSLGLRVARRSTDDTITDATDVLVGDTIGEMGLYLRLARIAFVGRSMATGLGAATGGQNPLEPAMLGLPVLHGPNVENFRDAYAALDAGGGATAVAGEAELTAAVRAALADPEAAIEAGRKAEATVGGMRGPLRATLTALGPFIEPLAIRARMERAVRDDADRRAKAERVVASATSGPGDGRAPR